MLAVEKASKKFGAFFIVDYPETILYSQARNSCKLRDYNSGVFQNDLL